MIRLKYYIVTVQLIQTIIKGIINLRSLLALTTYKNLQVQIMPKYGFAVLMFFFI